MPDLPNTTPPPKIFAKTNLGMGETSPPPIFLQKMLFLNFPFFLFQLSLKIFLGMCKLYHLSYYY